MKNINEKRVIKALLTPDAQQELAGLYERRMAEAQALVAMVEDTPLSGPARGYLEALARLFVALRRADAQVALGRRPMPQGLRGVLDAVKS